MSVVFYQLANGVARSIDGVCDLVKPGGSIIDELNSRGSLSHLTVEESGEPLDLASMDIEVPFQPSRMFLVGMNFESHLVECDIPVTEDMRTPEGLRYMSLPPNISGLQSVGHKSSVELPSIAPDMVDYESEIAVVIGCPASKVSIEDAHDYIAGVSAINDMSARDLQWAAMNVTRDTINDVDAANVDIEAALKSKVFPGFKPFGPGIELLPPDELNPSIVLEAHVNGELRQKANANEMLHSIATCVSVISQTEDLRPGDIICTGAPAGSGFATEQYLRPGDEVSIKVGSMQGISVTMISAK